MTRGVAVLLVLLGLGCSLQGSALLPNEDASDRDVGRSDASFPDASDGAFDGARDAPDGAPVDSGVTDSSAPDVSPSDTSTEDTSVPPDTSMPDTSMPDTSVPPDTSMPPPSCDSLFAGFVPGYVFCAERTDECEFYTYTSGGPSCRELCAMAGRTCVTSYAEGATDCERTADYGCDHRHTDGICICSR